jgi:hypothetical protein
MATAYCLEIINFLRTEPSLPSLMSVWRGFIEDLKACQESRRELLGPRTQDKISADAYTGPLPVPQVLMPSVRERAEEVRTAGMDQENRPSGCERIHKLIAFFTLKGITFEFEYVNRLRKKSCQTSCQ